MSLFKTIPTTAAATLLLAMGSVGCSTIPGTAISPITGGVDLLRFNMDRGGSLLTAPFVFVGGAVSGPLVALWNGIHLDVPWAFSKPARARYWEEYPQTFRPFEMIDRRH